MEVKTVKISELKPHPKNPRVHPDSAIEKLERSIKEFGWTNPILVSADGYILAGHARLKAAEKAGISEVPVIYLPLEGAKAEAYLIADNRLQDETDWDYEKLKELLKDLDTGELDLELTGFDMDEIEELIAQLHVPGEIVEDEVPEPPKEPITKPGDLWILGRHRLLCGDATKKEDVERLMDGKKADMVFTDPPYGIDKEIKNDDLKGDEFIEWNSDWLSKIPTGTDAGFVCYHSTRTFPSLMIPAMESGWKFERMLWFHRPDKFPVHTWNGWMLTSQAILIFSKGEVEYKKVSPADQDYYRCTSKELTVHTGHPTEKIVSHLAKVMEHYAAELLYDPFGGSGSTLIACEQLNRTCYMMEIDPIYCDVIVQRYINLKGHDGDVYLERDGNKIAFSNVT